MFNWKVPSFDTKILELCDSITGSTINKEMAPAASFSFSLKT